MRAAVAAGAVGAVLVGLAACGDVRHEPVRVIAQPRAPAPEAPPIVPAPVAASAPQPLSTAASAPLPRPRGLDATPPMMATGAAPPRREWQPGEPNGNADFRAALEARQRGRGEPVASP